MTEEISTSDRDLVLQTLRGVCLDDDAPAAARAQAARSLAEIVGLLGRLQASPLEAGRSMTELSAAELDAEIARLSGKR